MKTKRLQAAVSAETHSGEAAVRARELRPWRGVKPVGAPTGVAISTRLCSTADDQRVLDLVAAQLGRLRRSDLAAV